MQFTGIQVDSFGVLKKTGLAELSPGLTLVYGGNGSGKTTLVAFLRGLLFGFTSDHTGFHPDDSDFGGDVTLREDHRSFRLHRERNQGRSTLLQSTEIPHGTPIESEGNHLPSWVNETVYREIFSVGDQEASRFDLLSRLCLEESGRPINDEEVHRTERAINKVVSERDGHSQDRGTRARLTDLQNQRDVRLRQLAQMREADPTIPARIAELERRIADLRAAVAGIDRRITEVQAEILRLEELLERLRRRNVVNLDRQKIESELSSLRQKQARWASIRNDIQSEVSLFSHQSKAINVDGLCASDSLNSIRALVSRLEERVESLDAGTGGLNGSFSLQKQGQLNNDIVAQHVRDEVHSLCQYLSKHQEELGSYEAAMESALTHKALQDADQVHSLVQGRIESLTAELNRGENVLNHSHTSYIGCESHSHQSSRHQSTWAEGSIVETEQHLARLRQELSGLQQQRSEHLDMIQRLEIELNDLRARLKPVARLHDVDRVKAEVASLDAEIQLTQQRIEVLNASESQLKEVLRRLGERRQQSVLELASRYINRLTDGDCYRLMADSDGTAILAETRQSSRPQGLQQLSRGTRDQVALALRLALIQVRAESTQRCPLVLDDVFITSDDERAAAVADLLMEIAAGGQQIIFLSCQNDVLDLFRRREATIRTLEDAPVVSMPMPVMAPPQPVAPAPKPVVQQPVAKLNDQTNWLFYLEVDNTIDDLCGLSVAELEALRAADVNEVDTLLSLPAEELEGRLRQRGYSITRDRIRAWRGQAELSTQVPMLRRSDAELLYAAGIQSPVELSRMRPETVFDQVVAFQESAAGLRFRRSGRQIDRQQAINWTRWSQHARSLSEARHSRSRYFVRTSDGFNSPSDAGRRARAGQSSVSSRRARISSNGDRTSVRQRRPRLTSTDRRHRDERLAKRRQRLARHSSSYRTHSADSAEEKSAGRELRFFLSRSSDIESAPSIGPKTAQRLSRVDIYTVDDLLKADVEVVADKLDNRRINADTIRQWQDQARLICQVPELRGHDAQILVACGVTQPEQLAAKRPVDLLALVGPFAETSEGERIVRGGSKPDLEEVTDWIHYAQQSRTLSAAA
ncbi:MAG: DUF4332 domain-containing protein [Fuerstiella sp.]